MPSGDFVEFYFNNKPTLRISEKFVDLLSGKKFPLLVLLLGIDAGGFYTSIPHKIPISV